MYISEKNIGDIVLIDDIGKSGSEYIVIQKGRPSSKYDSMCDGVWLMRKNALGPKRYDSDENEYNGSDLYFTLYLDYHLNSSTHGLTRTLKVPYYDSNAIVDGEGNGHLCSSCVLSAMEAGFSTIAPLLGTMLAYFKNGGDRKCCYDDGSPAVWWTRTPKIDTTNTVYAVSATGDLITCSCNEKCGYRPVVLAANDLRVDENNYLRSKNYAPVITADITNDLGTLTEGFTCNYSVNDKDAKDNLTVTLKIDDNVIQKFQGVREQQETYTLGGEEWLKIPNGQHTFNIILNDGSETVRRSAAFTRNCTSMIFTLSPPLQTEKLISIFNLKVFGNIPPDCEIIYEACNNANDPDPAWEDITSRVKAGFNHVFKNMSAQNGYAINFKITAKRGSSNAGGFIDKIICEYE